MINYTLPNCFIYHNVRISYVTVLYARRRHVAGAEWVSGSGRLGGKVGFTGGINNAHRPPSGHMVLRLVSFWSFALLLHVSRARWFRSPFSPPRVPRWPLAFTFAAFCGFVLFAFVCLAPRVGVGLRTFWRWFRLSCRRLCPALGVVLVGRAALVVALRDLPWFWPRAAVLAYSPLFGASRWSTQASK